MGLDSAEGESVEEESTKSNEPTPAPIKFDPSGKLVTPDDGEGEEGEDAMEEVD